MEGCDRIADDTNISQTVNNPDQTQILQNNLNAPEDWYNLRFNAEKCRFSGHTNFNAHITINVRIHRFKTENAAASTLLFVHGGPIKHHCMSQCSV